MAQPQNIYQFYEFRRIPRGKTYRALIRHLARFCSFVSFAIEEYTFQMQSPRFLAILELLHPDLVEAKKRSACPGMWTPESTDPEHKRKYAKYAPTVHVYRLTPHVLSVITTVANSLYSWEGPDYPDSMALLRESWEPCLVTLPGDRLAYMYLTRQEMEELVSAVPVSLKVADEYYEPERWWVGTEIEEE